MSDIGLEEWLSQTEYRAYRVVDHVGASSNKERVMMDGLENLAEVRREASRLRKRIEELEEENERLRDMSLETKGDLKDAVKRNFTKREIEQILKEVTDE